MAGTKFLNAVIALHGIGASKGIAIGRLHMLDNGRIEVQELRLRKSALEPEVRRFERALRNASNQLKLLKQRIPGDTAVDIAAFIDTHLLMLEDAAISDVPIRMIREQQCNAEWALKQQRDALVAAFDAMDDPYLKTRRDDVDQVVTRVQRILADRPRRKSGKQTTEPDTNIDFSDDHIVFADDLTPADTAMMQHQGVLALLTEFGGPNSHTAIIARSLRIPAVVGLHSARQFLRKDDAVIVDGREGIVLIRPDEESIKHYMRLRRNMERQHVARMGLRDAPCVSKDGETVSLQANVELPSDVQQLNDVGASGVGLYRTEYLFMNRNTVPDEQEQFEVYRTIVEGVNGPVTIRTLDLGADKQVDGGRPGAPISANPALGLRAVRLCLREHALFKPQLRAILRVSSLGPVRMMVPMVSTTQELSQVMQVVAECRHELEAEGQVFDPSMPIGAMIEVPAAAICADIFARQLDFLSIGTNDLIQYTIAIDRGDDEVNYLYDPMHPGVLRLIQMTIKAGQKAGIPVAMCGEMAGDCRYTRLLLGLGLKEFSVQANSLLEVKQVISESHIGEARRLTQRLMRAFNTERREAMLDALNNTAGW